MTPGLKHMLRRAFGIDAGRDRRGPSVVSVESRRCTPTVLAAGRRPLYVRGHRGLQRYKVTHDGTEKKRPASTGIRS
jgi:hypothetical protein